MEHTGGTSAAPVEAVVVAELLGCAPEELSGIKLRPGESGVYDAPELPGFIRSKGEITFTTPHGNVYPRDMVRYDSPNGTLLVVPHEDGSEIWTVVGRAKELVELAGGITGLIAFFKTQYPNPDTSKKIRKRSYKAGGDVKAGSEKDLSDSEQTDERKLERALRTGADVAPPPATS